MAWVAVSETWNGKTVEKIFHKCPIRKKEKCRNGYYLYYHDDETYNNMRGYTTYATDCSIELPTGSIEKLIGRKLTVKDTPVLL